MTDAFWIAVCILLYLIALGMTGFGFLLLLIAVFPKKRDLKASLSFALAGFVTIGAGVLIILGANAIMKIGGFL